MGMVEAGRILGIIEQKGVEGAAIGELPGVTLESQDSLSFCHDDQDCRFAGVRLLREISDLEVQGKVSIDTTIDQRLRIVKR